MNRQGGYTGWECNDDPDDKSYVEIWKTYSIDDEIRTEQDRRRFPIIIRVWDEIDGEYAVETEDERTGMDEIDASRRTFSSKEDAKQEARRRIRRINEDNRLFASSISEDEIDSVISSIRYSSRNKGQLGDRLQKLGKKLKKGHRENQREHIP